ncbi:peptide/nickel transport system substrate-binding protein [Tamaricihabitans halophyticus]|uniref:Peptide/nickel transport system substrate-binding protein n=1 Tax=Tamaricihabitans halophyticus TaxID=1262583 RepID=A0A4R2QY17_9PSEU|nr:ABC transporter substrate-binding protein [Tamaricihabitans halophyticus]TCP54274.1 peptide/nickel transport system substrate-binding protein [Tamaricihabitans halophyticus]
MPHRKRSLLCVLAAATLVSGCFAGGQGEGTDRIQLGLAFPPVKAMSPFSDDAATATRMGTAETLVTLDAEGTPQPALAASWRESDPTTWRLRLRTGATFHDGTPVTAKQVVASLQQAKEATPTPRSLAETDIDFAAEGEHIVVVRTAEADPVLIQRLSSPELMILAERAYQDDPTAPNPVRAGTGPYVLTKVNGATSATLEAFDDYWGGKPATPGIDVRFLSEGDSRARALRAEELDIAQALPAGQLGSLDADQLVSVPLPRTVNLSLNQESPVFRDAELRAAARAAVADLDIAKTIYEGDADPPAGLFGPASSWAEKPGYPEAKAADPNGRRISLATYSDRAELPEAASAVAEALRKAGFQVSVEVKEYAALEPALLRGDYDAVIGARSYVLDTGDPIGWLASDLACDGGYNLARYCDAEVDGLIRNAAEISDPAERNAAAVDISEQILAADVLVPLAHEKTRFGLGEGVTGIAEDPFERQIITKDTAKQ